MPNISRLLRLVREALIYLVHAIGFNETQKDNHERSISLNLHDYPVKLKR